MSILSSAYSWVNLKFLLAGLGVTLEVSVISIVLSFVIGLILGIVRYVGFKYVSVFLLQISSEKTCVV